MYDAALKPAEEDEAGAEARGIGRSASSRSMLWKDTKATSRRFFYSMVLLIPAVLLGLHMGLFPYVGVFFLRFVLFFDKIVALSLLPILFIAFGIDELSKIMLIVIGVTPTIILDTFNLTRGVPPEQIVKAFTLGAGDFDVAYRVVLKQIAPRVLNSIRLNLKAVMLFLFAGEMIASTDGLAYRIALLRRHMGMDVIIPYVLWVALLLFLVDLGMRLLNRSCTPGFGRHNTMALIDIERRLSWPTARPRGRCSAASICRLRRANSSACWARPAAASPRCCAWCWAPRSRCSGRVLIDGREHHQPDRTRGYVPQKYSLFPDKTVLDNITFGPEVSEFSLLARADAALLSGAGANFASRRMDYLRRIGLRESDARKVSRPALGRHAAARGDRPGADDAAAHSADGRGLQRARPRHPPRHAAADPRAVGDTGTTILFVTHNITRRCAWARGSSCWRRRRPTPARAWRWICPCRTPATRTKSRASSIAWRVAPRKRYLPRPIPPEARNSRRLYFRTVCR